MIKTELERKDFEEFTAYYYGLEGVLRRVRKMV